MKTRDKYLNEAVGFLDKYEIAWAEKQAKKLYGNDPKMIKCYMDGYKAGYEKGYHE